MEESNSYYKTQSGYGKTIMKVISCNLLIFAVYQVITYILVLSILSDFILVGMFSTGDSVRDVVTGYGYIVHSIINMIIAFIFLIKKDYKLTLAFFLSSHIILIIGFGTCILIS